VTVRRFARNTFFILATLLVGLIGFVGILLTTDWGQRFVTKQVNGYLARKLDTPFRIGRIAYDIPDYLELTDVFFADRQGDTLLLGKRLRVDLDMMALLQNRIQLNQIELTGIRVDVRRTLPDTTYNFQFLLDAFSSPEPDQPADTASTPLDLALRTLRFDDVRIRYADDVTGVSTNVFFDSLRAGFDRIDLTKQQYHLRTLTVDGLDAKARVYPGITLAETTPAPPPVPGDTMDLRLGTWTLRRSRWDVSLEDAQFATRGSLRYLATEFDALHLNSAYVGLRALTLAGGDIQTRLTRPPANPAPAPTPPPGAAPATESPAWRARLGQVRLANHRIRFDDDAQSRAPRGLDYAHLDLQNLTLRGQDFFYSPARIAGRVRGGRLRDRSGLDLRQLNADLVYADTLVSVTNLLVRTPRTLLRDALVLRYDSLGQLSRPAEAARVGVRVNLRQSTLAVADVLDLAPFLAETPPFAGNRDAVLRVNAQASGTLAALNIPTLEMAYLDGTRIRATGRLTNANDPDRLGMDLRIMEATTSRADLARLLPKGTLPDSVALAPNLRLTGELRGTVDNLRADARLDTDWGAATFDGTVAGFVSGKNQRYQGAAAFEEFQANKWLMNPQLGTITARANVDGAGIDPKTMRTSFRLDVDEATYNGYRYRDVSAEGQVAGGTLEIVGGSNDPNARLRIDTRVGLQEEYPSVRGTFSIETLDLKALNLYAEPLALRGDIELDLSSTNPVEPQGRVFARNASVTLNGQTYAIDSLSVDARTQDGERTLVARVPFAEVEVVGNYAYNRLPDLVIGEISRYVRLPELQFDSIQPPYYARIDAWAYQHPLLRAFVPGLTRLDTVRLNAYIDNRLDTTLLAQLRTGIVEYDTTVVQNTSVLMLGVGNELITSGTIDAVRGTSFALRRTELSALAENNTVQFRVVTKDSVDQDRHGVAGRLLIADDAYQLSLNQNALLTNYRSWTADTAGYIRYSPAGVVAENFTLRTNGQQELVVNSIEPVPNAPLRVEARNVDLSDLASVANQDTTLVGGLLNANVVLRDYLPADSTLSLSFTGQVRVDSLEVMEQPLGTLTAAFVNAPNDRIQTELALQGPLNNVQVTGFYNTTQPGQALDFNVNLWRLDARTIEAFSFGELRRARGQLVGQLRATGAVDQPQLQGEIRFDSVAFNVKQLNATYRIHQEAIAFAGSTIRFQDFDLRDTLGRELSVDGTVTLQKLPDVGYDLQINADRFLALNAARKDNDYAYGQASVTANLRIRGEGANPSISGRVKLDEGSKVTAVLPDDSPAVNDATRTVIFIDHNDSLALEKYLVRVDPADTATRQRLTFEGLSESFLNLNLEVDDKSEITVIIDELNGDNLRVRGNAQLTLGIDAGGQISLSGRYEITEGEYALTYQVLKRQFAIQRGSTIIWTGDPYKADLNVTAIYQANAVPADLIGNEIARAPLPADRQRTPFNVLLSMSGNLTAPQLSFDIRLPEDQFAIRNVVNDDINAKLAQLRQDPSEMNKQVFSLLLLNSFLSETSAGGFSGSGGTSAQTMAFNSVSKLLSEQLERLASNVIKGVDIDFNLLSADYAGVGQSSGSRTDLNVGVSKSFLAGRLTVAVGRNFVLANTTAINRNPAEVFDNVSLNYNLTRDGRYRLRAYRVNEFEAILEGFVVETGLAFVITFDYNTLKELLLKADPTLQQQ
jgi:translocation and assembly module TamB